VPFLVAAEEERCKSRCAVLSGMLPGEANVDKTPSENGPVASPNALHTVTVDIMEISPTSRNRYRKVVVIGDLFTRLVVAVPVKEESASTIANTLFDRWISIFGPPRRLLSDQGKPFVSAMVKHLCERIGTEKIETSAYHPQTDGMVERYNRTLCEDLAK
jgi:transposase InsO family protein